MIPEIMGSTELSLKNSSDKTFVDESEPLALTDRLGVNQSVVRPDAVIETFNTEESEGNDKQFNEVKLDKNETEQSNLSDKAAALNAISFSIGSVIGPPLGGGLYDALTWGQTLLVMAAISLVSGTIYLIITCLTRTPKKA